MKKVLLTGFKPFLGDKTNPSELIVKHLEAVDIVKHILPVEFEKAFLELKQKVELHQPKYILMLGLASGATRIRLEKVAMNWNESLHADESGYQAPMDKIDPKQNLSLMTQFPINAIYQKLNEKNYPVDISFSAGSFVCNNVYFKTLNTFPKAKSIFIHVPSENILRIEWQAEVIKEIIEMLP